MNRKKYAIILAFIPLTISSNKKKDWRNSKNIQYGRITNEKWCIIFHPNSYHSVVKFYELHIVVVQQKLKIYKKTTLTFVLNIQYFCK